MSALIVATRPVSLVMTSLLLGAASLIAGCGSLAVGDSQFSCPGHPSDPLCLPTSQVYALTNSTDAATTPTPESDSPAPATPRHRADRDSDHESPFGWAAPKATAKRSASPPSAVAADLVTSPGVGAPEDLLLPRSPDPIPLRMPAQVMRIWLAPWEDRQSDLHASGYVFTEITPKTWTLAAGPDRFSQALLKPLQIEQRAPATGAPPSTLPGSSGAAPSRP